MNKDIYKYALWLLSKKDYSVFKITQKFKQKFPDNSSDFPDVIKELESHGYININNYKRTFIKKWLLKGESFSKIILRAAQENLEISKNDFIEFEVEIGISSHQNIQTLIEKKLRNKEIPADFKEKQKLKDKILRYLISKGHSFDSSRSELNKFL
jgi:regulatory protein